MGQPGTTNYPTKLDLHEAACLALCLHWHWTFHMFGQRQKQSGPSNGSVGCCHLFQRWQCPSWHHKQVTSRALCVFLSKGRRTGLSYFWGMKNRDAFYFWQKFVNWICRYIYVIGHLKKGQKVGKNNLPGRIITPQYKYIHSQHNTFTFRSLFLE